MSSVSIEYHIVSMESYIEWVILCEPRPLYRRLDPELLRAMRASQTGGASGSHWIDVLQSIKMGARARSRPFRRPAATYGRDYQINNTSGYSHILRGGEHFGVDSCVTS